MGEKQSQATLLACYFCNRQPPFEEEAFYRAGRILEVACPACKHLIEEVENGEKKK